MREGEHHRVIVVGTGFSGIGMAIELRRRGETDFIVLERASEVGGTWRDNTYPGCRCDVPSHLYSFSFAPNPAWSNTFSAQPEILDYLRETADSHGVLAHVRFEHELLGADWDDDAGVWRLETSQGDLSADILISGQGPLSEPSVPELPGLERFEGTSFHSADWDHGHDLAGERVAVIGTGASAIQFVPEIQPQVGSLHVFQRTAPWVVPHPNREVSRAERVLYRLFPPAQRLMRAAIYWARETFVLQFRRPRSGRFVERMALRHLHAQVRDPELREKLRPPYAIGCKRILPTDRWYPALAKPNVEVVTDGIAEIRERSIVGADGSEREVDTIIFGTGFHVTDLPIADRIRGRDGRSLGQVWQGSPSAYKGTAVPGYPNLFLLVGPNTGLGHTSIVIMIEAQIRYIAETLDAMRRVGASTATVRPAAAADWNAELERLTRGTVWVSGGCSSYYIDRNGHNSALWPTYTWPFRQRLAEFDAEAWELSSPVRQPLPAAA